MNSIATFFRESKTARFFIPLGLILIIFGVIVFIINTQNKDYIEVESTVSNVKLVQDAYTDTDGNFVEAEYDLTVTYTVYGREYSGELNNMSKANIGDKITIYYNPKDPSQITQTKSLVLPIVMIAGGLASLIGGIVNAVNAVKRCKKMKEQERSW
jgi:hypothetical protein